MSREAVRFFDPSAFHSQFLSHFGPIDFMGLPLRGMVDSDSVRPLDARVQHRWRGAVVARLCAATTRTRFRHDHLGCSWPVVVRLSPFHAA